MATVTHQWKQQRAVKRWNDKDAANLPATVMRGFNVVSTVDPLDPTKYNVVISSDADGAGWYSSLRLPNGILVEEVVETIKSDSVDTTAFLPGWIYILIVCRCPWTQDENLQPTYEYISHVNLDPVTDTVIATVAITPVAGGQVVVYPTTPGARNWPIDRIQSTRGVKQKLSVDFKLTSMPAGSDTDVRGHVCVPNGFQYYTLPDDTAPVAHLRVTAWAYLTTAPGAGQAVYCRPYIYLGWDPQDGTGPVVYSGPGAYDTTVLDGYGGNDLCKVCAHIDVSTIFSTIPVGTVVPADAMFRVYLQRVGTNPADTYAWALEAAAMSLEIVQTKPGEAF